MNPGLPTQRLLLSPMFLLLAAAQEPAGDSERDLPALEETVVTATRFEHPVHGLPHSVNVVDLEQIEHRNLITPLDTLNETIGIWVEKRNGVSSDPILRGFSGGNILALIDGNSLTTLWGEGGYAGDDMYGKIDGESIERIEVLRGPSSVLYGSNNLGGVIQFITRKPPAYTSGNHQIGASLKTAFWGASNGSLLRGDVYGSTDSYRYRLGYSMRDIGDTRGGGDLGLLSPSGINDSNFDLNTEMRLGPSDTLEVNAQLVNRNGLSKYYKPTQRNNNDRLGTSVRWRSTDIGFGEEMSWSVYYQNKQDERYWLDQEKDGVASWESFATDFQSMAEVSQNHLLTWGLHVGRDIGESPDDEQFTITTPATGTQKGAPDSTWDNLGVYAQDEWALGDDWSLTVSARFDYFRYDTEGNTFYTNPGSTGAENRAETAGGTHNESSVTGGLGLVRHLDEDWMAFGSWSRGYRLFAPGFGLRQTGYGVLAPTDGFLDPTTADQFEIGTRVRRSWWSASVAGYYSFLHGVQQPTPGSYNGDTTIDIDGDGNPEQIYVTTGASGFVTGIEIDTAIELGHFDAALENWTWHNGFMANYGTVALEGGDEPLRHTHPARFLSALRWQDRDSARGRWFEFVSDLVAPYTRVADGRLAYNGSGQFIGDVGYLNDPQDKTSGLLDENGLPGYVVFHARGGINITPDIQLTVGIENLLDRKYRTAHSRMDASGRNVMIGLRASF